MVSWFRCMQGPRLYKTYNRVGPEEGKLYEPNSVESCSDNVIRSLSFVCSLGIYTSPVIIAVLGRRGYFTIDGLVSCSKLFAALSIILISSFWLRGMGRLYNAEYRTFLNDLLAAQANLNPNTKKALMRYDFQFSAWPTEFSVSEGLKAYTPRKHVDSRNQANSTFDRLTGIPGRVLGYIVAHSFGRHLVYPGSIGLLQTAMGSMLLSGRTRLVEEFGGERFKVETIEKNVIDIMVVDRRNNPKYPNGNILVICTEGNAGFYEVGIMSTPLEVGYSVIGWNHPGFSGSTGAPFPDQEANGIDAVIQFALRHMNFVPSDIVLFAWSIGGYSATWAAMNYPEVRGVILDATFDDLVPLAVAKMPRSLKPIIVKTVRDHMNLPNAEQLCQYHGPVRLIRRTKDEMITTSEIPQLEFNRGNDLLVQFLQHRYPRLIDDHVRSILHQWLIGDKIQRNSLINSYQVDEELCLKMISSHFEDKATLYPSLLGEGLPAPEKIRLALFLANVTMVDFNSTHCTPLPKQMFQLPLDLTQDNGFVKVTGDVTTG